MKKVLLALVLLGLGTGVALANPNDLANGVFITHYPPGLLYTTDPTDWCARYQSLAINSCAQQNPRIDNNQAGAVWYVLAAWNETDKTWCGTEFGIGSYNPASLTWVANGVCPASALTIPYGAWPGPNTGMSLAATGAPWAGNFTPVYYFGCYAYTADLIPLRTHPNTGFAGFANCLTPPTSYPAVCLGAMGLFRAGTACCAPVPVPHVCCVGEQCMLVFTQEECAGMGGVWHPEWDGCGPPNPCARPHVCCVGENCYLVLEQECAAMQGVFHPEWDSCGPPNPCALSHVCCVGEDCFLVLEEECATMQGIFHPEWDSCGPPNPCQGATPNQPDSWGGVKNLYR